MSCDDPTFNQTLCQNVTNAGNIQMIKFMSRQIKGLGAFMLKVKAQTWARKIGLLCAEIETYKIRINLCCW